ncbi:MAG TPA: LysR family transcriptional regulator [Clostridiales bacterium]|nr:LysR family transcriptional regulator [Clostridiales bacterium]
MELLQLKYFCVAARYQNFTKAAEYFSIPQSSISKTIANLERELGCKLFDRAGRHVYLNETGKVFLEKAEVALRNLEDGVVRIQELSSNAKKNIRLAVWEGSKLLPDILTAFGKVDRTVSFSLVQHSNENMLQDFDLCISALPLNDNGLDFTPLITEEILLALPVDHPLAGRDSIELPLLKDESFIGLTSGKSLRRITDAYCNMHGFLPKIIFESDDPATVRGLIENGLGVAFIPEKTWKSAHTGKIKYLRIKGGGCRRTIAISWHKGRHLPESARKFKQFVIDWYGRL